MNTTALRSSTTFAPQRKAGSVAPTMGALRSTLQDFVAGILSVTKAGLLEQQPTRPRLRRF